MTTGGAGAAAGVAMCYRRYFRVIAAAVQAVGPIRCLCSGNRLVGQVANLSYISST